MSVKTTPEFLDNVVLLAAQATGAAGSGTTARIYRATWDLSLAFGGFLHIDFGRTGTTAVSVGISAHVNRMLNGAAITRPGGINRQGNTITASSNVNTTDAASGQNTWISTNSLAGFAVGDAVLISDAAATRAEWQEIAAINGTTVTFRDNLLFTHTAVNGDKMTNKADSFAPLWLPGGSQYEILLDYSQGTGDAQIIRVLGQKYTDEITQ